MISPACSAEVQISNASGMKNNLLQICVSCMSTLG